jgi:hypothetical protein
MGWSGRKERAGWVKAPSEVELEIRSVWQEDEMPDEIKNAPGYRPFTLGLDAQAWVDSMAEIADGGDAVYGRPRPVTPQQHPSLTSLAPSLPLPTPTPSQPSHPTTAPSAPSTPRVLMPDIDDAPSPPPAARPPAPSAPRVLMPDVDDGPPPPSRTRTLPPRVSMPDIGDDEERPEPKPPRPLMPDIG